MIGSLGAPALGWSTLGLPPFRPDREGSRLLDAVVDAGYSLLEIHASEPVERSGRRAGLLTDGDRARVRWVAEELRRREGRALLGLGSRHLLGPVKHEPTLFDEDPAGRQLRVSLVADATRLAGEIGSPAIVFLSGPSAAAGDPTSAKVATEPWRRLGDSMALLTAVAREAGVILAPELHSRHLLARFDDLDALRIDHPSIGATADTAHQGIMEPAPLREVYRRRASTLTHVQLDNVAKVGSAPAGAASLPHVPIDADGSVDVRGALFGLIAGGYAGAVAVEFLAVDHPATDPMAYCRSAANWLRGALAEATRTPTGPATTSSSSAVHRRADT